MEEDAQEKVKILIVDDRPSNQLSLKAVLELPEYDLVLASSGDEALHHVLRDDFAVILLDVAMPGLDGFATATLIKQRERSKKIPIIFVTASVFDIDHIFRGYTVGAVDYLQKPIDPHAVRAKVAVFVELFRQARQIAQQAARLRESDRQERELLRLRGEADLARSRAEFQATFDQAPLGIGHAGRDRRWTRVNPRLASILGLTAEQMLAGRFLELAHRQDAEALARAFDDIVEGRLQSHHSESRFTRADGRNLWLSTSLSLLGGETAAERRVIVIVEDVTERRETEDALRASEARFRRLRESGMIGISFWRLDGTITDANQAFLEIAGASREMLDAGRLDWRRLTPPEYEGVAAGALEELRSTGICGTYERGLLRPDGRIASVLVGSALVDSAADMAVGFFLDVTERKRIEVERARHLQELRNALQARDDFLSIAAHELKTPLTPLRLQLASLMRMVRSREVKPSPDRIRHALESVDQSTMRLERLIDTLLDLSRIRVGRLRLELEEVEMTALVHEAADRLRTSLEAAGCTVAVHAEDKVAGRWDHLRLGQAITNIIANAIKYGAGKPIEIEVGGDEQVGRFSVRDHGIGIAPEEQARIFERFERLVPVRHFGGFGLGLWIVRKIVEAHGGHIDVWSEPGQGSRFTVELPREPLAQIDDVPGEEADEQRVGAQPHGA